MANNDWFGKFKNRAKTMQETAKNKLEKLSETVEKKMKEVQDTEKQQRTKTESELVPSVLVWRPSSDNPDGKIVTEQKPITPPSLAPVAEQQPIISPTVPSESEPTVSASLPAEVQQTPVPVEEIVVSRRTKGKKSSTKKSSSKQTENQEENANAISDVNKETVDQDTENKLDSERSNTISAIPEIVEDTSMKSTPTKEEITPVQESSSQSETDINQIKNESVLSESEINQQDNQPVTSDDTFAADTNTTTTTENRTIEQSDQANALIDTSIAETIKVVDSYSENVLTTSVDTTDTRKEAPETEQTTPINTDTSLVEDTISENIQKETSSDEIIPTSNNDQIPIEIPTTESKDEAQLATTMDELPVEPSITKDSVQEHTSVHESSSLTDTEQLPIEQSINDNAGKEIREVETSTVTNNDRVPLEEYIPADELLTSTNTNKSIVESSVPEKDIITEHLFVDEQPTLTHNNEINVEDSVPEDTHKDLSNDDPIVKTPPVDEPSSLTDNIETTVDDSIPEDIHQELSNDDIIEETPSVNESSTSGHIDQLTVEDSVPENTYKEESNDELIVTANTDHVSTEDLNTEINPMEELSNIDKTDQSFAKPLVAEISYEEAQKDDLTTEKSDNHIPQEDSLSENIPINELKTCISTEELDVEQSAPENSHTEMPTDDNLQRESPVPEDTSINPFEDESPVEQTVSKNIYKEESDYELTPSAKNDEVPIEVDTSKDEPSSPINVNNSFADQSDLNDKEKTSLFVDSSIDAFPGEKTSSTVVNVIDDQSVNQVIDNKVPDTVTVEPSDEQTIISDITEDDNIFEETSDSDKTPVDDTKNDSIPTRTDTISNDNLLPSTNTVDSTDVNRNSESTSTDTSNDDFVLSTKSDEIPVDSFEAEYIQIKTPDDIISTDTQSDSETVLTDVPNEKSPSQTSNVNVELANLTTNKTDEELLTSTSLTNSFEINAQTRNLLSHVLNEELPPPPVTTTTETSVLTSKSEDTSNTSNADTKLEKSPSSTSNVQLPATTSVSDSPVKTIPPLKEEVKKLLEKPKAKNSPFDGSDSDDDFLMLSTKKKRPLKVPDIFDDQPVVTKVKIKTPLKEPEDIFEKLTISKVSTQKSTTEPSKESKQLSSLRSFISTIQVNDDGEDDLLLSKSKKTTIEKHVKTTVSLSPFSSDKIRHDPPSPVVSQKSRLSDEKLFEETTTPVSTVTTQSNPFDEENETNPFNEENETNPFEDTKESTSKVTVQTNPFVEDEEPTFTAVDDANPFGEIDEPTSKSSKEINPFEEEDDDDGTNPFDEIEEPTSTNPFDENTEPNSTMSTVTKPSVRQRYSIINYQPIPSGIKISQMNCSSMYIYFCTTDRKLFFAELNSSDLSTPLDWQQHGDLAERLVVSVSNRTVWRLFNKHIFIANDPIHYPPFGSHWNKIKIEDDQSLLSMSISDQCGWYVKEDGTLWFLRTDDKTFQSTDVPCPYRLDIVFCFAEKVGVTTNIGEILIRAGCTTDCPEGGGWLFIEKSVGFINDFILLTNNDIMMIMDKKHRLWMHEWSTKKDFSEVLLYDDFDTTKKRYLLGVNNDLLCITDCEKGVYIYSDAITGVQWTVVEENTPYLRLFAAFPNEDYVWTITSNRLIGTSNDQTLDKPEQAGSLTHASFVPSTSSKKSILWSLDQSCGIYVRGNIEKNTIWEQADETQFEKKRKLLNIVCNNAGVWAVDDHGQIHFRHGHISANQHYQANEKSLLPPAWITVPGDAKRFRSFVQVFCGPADWMVYATDTKQNVYTRIGISADDRVGTAWKHIEDCSALELAISEHTLWLLTSHGQIQCRENISLENPVGTRSVTLSGLFRSLTVSLDDRQVWALDSKRNLLKLDRLSVLFKK